MLSSSTVLSSGPAGFSKLAVWAVVATLAVLAIRYLLDRCLAGRPRRNETTTRISDNVALYAKPILTEAEARFFRSLEDAVDRRYLVWPQLPLWTFIETRSNDRGASTSFKNRISLKRVDFCLVDRQTSTVHKAIELDDRTHQRSDRQHRDAFVETVLKQAGVPLIRIPEAKVYDSQSIRRQLGIDRAGMNGRKLPVTSPRKTTALLN